MKVNIICSEARNGWIYSKFISQLQAYSKNQIMLNAKEPCDINHCLPYYDFNDNIKHPCSIWLSHQEQRTDLYNKFIYATKNADIAFSQSKKYMDLMISQGTKNIVQIIPGVDLHKFHLRSHDRPPKDKLVVGFVGRQYSSSDRKNPKLLNKINKLPFVAFMATEGRIREADLPRFYSQCDIIVSPSFAEGGPLCLTEGLATGTPILCFAGVGMSNEFSHGVIKVPFGDDNAFINRLNEFWDLKEYLVFRKLDTMKLLRGQVEQFTWENFVKKHDAEWNKLCKQ